MVSVEEDVLAVPARRRRQDAGGAALQVRGRPHRARQANHEAILLAETQSRGKIIMLQNFVVEYVHMLVIR